jgi:hypothetical protein
MKTLNSVKNTPLGGEKKHFQLHIQEQETPVQRARGMGISPPVF